MMLDIIRKISYNFIILFSILSTIGCKKKEIDEYNYKIICYTDEYTEQIVFYSTFFIHELGGGYLYIDKKTKAKIKIKKIIKIEIETDTQTYVALPIGAYFSRKDFILILFIPLIIDLKKGEK